MSPIAQSGDARPLHLPHLRSGVTPKYRILVIDCDTASGPDWTDSMEALGHNVLREDGANEVAIARNRAVDIAVVDLDRRGIDSIDMLTRAYSERRAKPALIIVSGLGEEILRSASLCAAQHGHLVLGALSKPVEPSRLTKYMALAQNPAETTMISWRELPVMFSRLKAALDADGPLIEYQPKVSMRNRVFLGCEALLSANIPDLGHVPAKVQIEAIRMMGRLSDFTWQMTQRAIRESTRWQTGQAPRPVAINWPLETLLEPRCITRLDRLVEISGLQPACVTIELSEQEAYGANTKAVEAITRLRIRGYGISLDDFGQEHSNLYQLSILPITEAKIDRALISQMSDWPRAEMLIAETVTMFHRIGIHAVAEGVETSDQAARLWRLGCHEIQGHLIAKKMPLRDCLNWIRIWEKNSTPSHQPAPN